MLSNKRKSMSNELGLVLQVVGRLKGKQNGTFNGHDKWEVVCPYCDRKSGMIGRVKTGDYFLYACPACNTSTSLKNMVHQKMPDLKYVLTHNENSWYPIQNTSSKKGITKKKRSFKEKQETRSIAQEIMMRGRSGEISSQ